MPTAFAIGAHPDDIEFFMAGTLLLLREAGWTTHYMNLANGCCGSTTSDARRTAQIRAEESAAAAKLSGCEYHASLVDDMEVYYERSTLKKVAAVIREVSPQLVLTHPPVDYMEDHTNTCRLVVSAAFARGMPNFATDPQRSPVDGSVVVYHSQPHGNRDPLGNLVYPQVFVNAKPMLEMKVQMLACHKSQQAWLESSQNMSAYLEEMQALMREVGALSGHFEYAEGWRRHLHWGFCQPDEDPLVDALPSYVAFAN